MKTKTKKFKCYIVTEIFFADNQEGIGLFYRTKKRAAEAVLKMNNVTPNIPPEKIKIMKAIEIQG
jgi:hypothetical protein